MASDKAKQAIESATSKLVEALKAGKSEALTAYLESVSRFHQYSFRNTMLIHSQCPTASYCAGFQSWKKLGRYVKRGETGIAILAPMIGKVKAEQDEKAVEAKEEKRIYGFRVVYVFDYAQTDGKPLPELGKVSGITAAQFLPHIQQAIADHGIVLEYSDAILPARGMSLGGKIQIISGMSEAEQLSTLAHEFAHELLHKAEKRKRTDRDIRELEAEAVAFCVCSACGLETGTAAQDYIGLYDGDADGLLESLRYVTEAAHMILKAILPDAQTTPTISSLPEQEAEREMVAA